MSMLEAYAVCTTVLAVIATMRSLREPFEKPTALTRVAGQILFALALVGLCALAAHGLVTIVEAVK